VPRLAWPRIRVGDTALAEARAALDWTREHFGVDRVTLAGVGFAAGVALQLAAAEPDKVSRLAVLAGSELEPWPQADDAFVAARLAALPTDLPLTWYDFEVETERAGQARQMRRALDDLGLTKVTDETVQGGLHPVQAADRIVLWAEADGGP